MKLRVCVCVRVCVHVLLHCAANTHSHKTAMFQHSALCWPPETILTRHPVRPVPRCQRWRRDSADHLQGWHPDLPIPLLAPLVLLLRLLAPPVRCFCCRAWLTAARFRPPGWLRP
jgi:hypothetical protein